MTVLRQGEIAYRARPDYHLLINENKLMVTKGARENRFRGGIDPQFRSAAVNHNWRVIRCGGSPAQNL